jgi:hypothetical protein
LSFLNPVHRVQEALETQAAAAVSNEDVKQVELNHQNLTTLCK